MNIGECNRKSSLKKRVEKALKWERLKVDGWKEKKKKREEGVRFKGENDVWKEREERLRGGLKQAVINYMLHFPVFTTLLLN